jgi:hypothetical protein
MASLCRSWRYAIRYPFTAHAEMLELQSGNRVSDVTSDISAGGCFVFVRRPLKISARVRRMLTHYGWKVEILAVVRSVKANVGMDVGLGISKPNRRSKAWNSHYLHVCRDEVGEME